MERRNTLFSPSSVRVFHSILVTDTLLSLLYAKRAGNVASLAIIVLVTSDLFVQQQCMQARARSRCSVIQQPQRQASPVVSFCSQLGSSSSRVVERTAAAQHCHHQLLLVFIYTTTLPQYMSKVIYLRACVQWYLLYVLM